MPEQFESKYFRGRGPLFLGDRDANGKPINLIFIGDISSAEMTPQVERGEVIENITVAGGVGASYLKSVRYGVNITMRSIKPAHLALALQGANAVKVGASVTDETHTVKLSAFSMLEHNKVSTVVVTGAGGTPTYVADTDYKVHADEGMIEWLTGGTVTDDLAVLIDYDYAAQHHITPNPGNIEKYLVFGGKNTTDSDKQSRCEIYKISLDPSVLSMITDENAEMSLTGVAKQDTTRASGDQYYSWKTED